MNRLTNLIHPKLKITAQAFHYAPPMPTHGTQPAKALYPFALQHTRQGVTGRATASIRSRPPSSAHRRLKTRYPTAIPAPTLEQGCPVATLRWSLKLTSSWAIYRAPPDP